MGTEFATVMDEGGVRVRSAEVSEFTLAELRFPSDLVQDTHDPELPYVAFVLDGSLAKSFPARTIELDRGSALVMPAGAAHGARFGPMGARVMIVKPKDVSGPHAGRLDRLVELRARSFGWLAWRLAAELRASDAAAPLAAEGLALELLAATSRDTRPVGRVTRPPAWLASAEELLRTRLRDSIGLGELADAVGVHPTHMARVFRARYGLSVGEYGRRVRLAWAASELARGDAPLGVIATQAGFADQSHFTRAFKRYAGMTPGRYRVETQAARR
jgi:AraC family transcriptional regulator